MNKKVGLLVFLTLAVVFAAEDYLEGVDATDSANYETIVSTHQIVADDLIKNSLL